MSDTPIYDKLSEEFSLSKAWWRTQGAVDELKSTLASLKEIKKPTKQTEDIIKLIQARLDEYAKKYKAI